jgi:hypothetical protein
MKKNNGFAEISLIKNYEGERPSLQKLSNLASKNNIKDFIIIEDLKVLDSKNFGKGYGKELFLSTINEIKIPILLSPSFSDCENYKSFSGREEMSMNNIKTAPINLLNKFYIPLLKKENKKFLIEKDMIIIFP